MTKVTDEMLMSLADGELEPATAADILRMAEADPALMARLEAFRETRSLAKRAFAPVLDEPMPLRLAAAARPAAGRANRSSGRSWLPIGATVAASLAGFLVAVAILDRGSPGFLPGESEIERLLATAPGGAATTWQDGTVIATGTYEVADGACRSFVATANGGGAWRGVACNRDGGWQVEMAVLDAAGDAFTPASARATEAVDAFLDAVGAGQTLDPAGETDLLRRYRTE